MARPAARVAIHLRCPNRSRRDRTDGVRYVGDLTIRLNFCAVSDTAPTRLTPPLPTTARLSLHLRDQAETRTSIPTQDHLRFQLDHALARDAVHTPLDTALLLHGLRDRNLNPILLRSNALDRATYLRRPDLGRTLHTDSITALQSAATAGAPGLDAEILLEAAQKPGAPSSPTASSSAKVGMHTAPPRTLFLLADGLSALALERHALPLLDATLPLLPYPLSLIPVVTNARVAIADNIGALLHAHLTVLLIGERPGLSAPDSLGVYITWDPQPGKTTDAERNCISNIRGPQGLSYTEAAHRIAHYIAEATRLQTTGIALKDPVTTPLLATDR